MSETPNLDIVAAAMQSDNGAEGPSVSPEVVFGAVTEIAIETLQMVQQLGAMTLMQCDLLQLLAGGSVSVPEVEEIPENVPGSAVILPFLK